MNKVAMKFYELALASLKMMQDQEDRPALLFSEKTLRDFSVYVIRALRSVGIDRETFMQIWREQEYHD